MEIVELDGDDNAANKTAQSIIDAIRPKEDEASKADDHKKHQYKNLVRNKESEAIAMSALWGMKKQNVNEGMNGWVQNGGATIVDWSTKELEILGDVVSAWRPRRRKTEKIARWTYCLRQGCFEEQKCVSYSWCIVSHVY